VQGQANDGRGALPASLKARFGTFGRAGSCHGWFAGGVHFRFFTEIGTPGHALRAGAPRGCGCTGAAISRQRNARPLYSMVILPFRPSLRFQLEKAIVVPHHPIVTDRPFTLQSKYPVQFCGARRATVIVLRPRRRAKRWLCSGKYSKWTRTGHDPDTIK
jgi:hypothetical protein